MTEIKTLEGYLNEKFGFHPRNGQHFASDYLQNLADIASIRDRVTIAEVACSVISAIDKLPLEDEEFSIDIWRRGETLFYPSITKPGETNQAHFTKADGVRFSPYLEEEIVNLDALVRYANNRERFIFDCTREYYEANGFTLDKNVSKSFCRDGRKWDESKVCVDHYWAFARNDDRFLVTTSYFPCLQVSVRYRNWKKMGITK